MTATTSRRQFLGMMGAATVAGGVALASCTSDKKSGAPSGDDSPIATATKPGTAGTGNTTTSQVITSVVATTQPPTKSAVATVPGTNRPPQFVMISFDGSGSTGLMEYWRKISAETGAKFSFFISGVYLLLPENKNLYQPPRHKAGRSDIGFFTPGKDANGNKLDPQADLYELLKQWKAAHGEGHEIGTHFNGHFCGEGSDSAVGSWSADDWKNEISQFNTLLTNVSKNNGLPAIDLPFGPADIKGGRTPCLQGKLNDVLYPTLAELGMRYDSSHNVSEGVWPSKISGLWSLPLHNIELVGSKLSTFTMDYNFFAQQSYLQSHDVNKAPVSTTDPALADQFRQQTYDSYKKYFHNAYYGTRSPLVIGHHFAKWNMSAYINAITELIREIAPMPEVHFVTKSTMCDWLEGVTPEQLKAFRNGQFDKLTKV